MTNEYLEMKLTIVEREISRLETKENSVGVNLRFQKDKQWKLIEQLEKENYQDSLKCRLKYEF